MSSWIADAIKNAVPVTQVAGVASGHYTCCPERGCPSRRGNDKKCRVKDDHFKCFRCGAWGNVFDWVMLEDDCSYQAARAKLALMGMDAKVSERDQSGRTVYRVRLGPFTDKATAEKMRTRLESSGIENTLVRVQR